MRYIAQLLLTKRNLTQVKVDSSRLEFRDQIENPFECKTPLMPGHFARSALSYRPEMEHIERALDFILNTKWSDLSLEVRHQLKKALLDNLGSQIAGSVTPASHIVTKFAVEQYSGLPEATVLVTGEKVNDGETAMCFGHPGVTVIPPFLAAVEKFKPNCTGEESLTALLVGYETGIRDDTYATYHSSGSWGAIAGVAAMGNLLQLDRTVLREAMGTAEYHAPIGPMRKGIIKPSMVKDSTGWGCGVAMSSLLMAQGGFTGVWPIFGDTKDPNLIESLGKDFVVMTLYFKQFAACRWAHPSLQAAANIKAKHNPHASEIESVRVRSHRYAMSLPMWAPKDTEEAQYNLAHPVACALIDGEVGPKQQTPPRLFDQIIIELSKKVEFELDPEFDKQFTEREISSVTVTLKGGTVLESGPTEPNWSEQTPPSDQEIENKFDKFVFRSLLGRISNFRPKTNRRTQEGCLGLR